jgi:phosphate transport system substrate-binding protein
MPSLLRLQHQISVPAFSRYQQGHPGVAVSYASVGSSAGITRFTAGKTAFGATDVPASAKDLAEASGGVTVQVPVDLGAVDVAYIGQRHHLHLQ